MNGLVDFALLAATLACSFGFALLVQNAALRLMLKAMSRGR
ncbi:MAG TPA: hypothetical protein VL285_12630 [Bryobacteraceae bacterium]|nr:hypothetical protein [Bryobacteraceae bacterium]